MPRMLSLEIPALEEKTGVSSVPYYALLNTTAAR